MSKMPAKKKSCFQITSVTQAQVAANSATDDTESLDDPDESRTEDVSSEIFDMSRTDFEPEVCDRSSSEETLNNVGESEAPGQLPAVTPLNGGFGMRHVVSVVHQGPGAAQVSNNAQPAASASTAAVGSSQTAHVTNSSSASTATTTIASCSSRFRVIKLDHGSGEPFRRGRWTCTEYYEKDSEGSVMSRTVDSIRHTNVTEPGPDRDSGLGATVGSVMAQVGVSGQGPDTSYDGSSFTSPSHALDPQQPHSFSVATQQVVSGSGSPESFSNKSVPVSIQQQVQGSSHVPVPHNLHPPAHDGVHQGAHLQKSPSMPPAQVQSLLYQPQHQLPLTHHLQTQPTLISAGQPEYGQQHLPITVSQTHPGANLSFGHAVGQGPSPVPTPVAGGLQVLGGMGEMSGIPGGVPLGSQPVTSASAVGMVTPGMPTSGFSLADESRRMSDASAQILAIQNKDMMKPLITEGLQLPSPAVNSLFGISIPIDGEDDRNPSTAFFQAFQSGSKLKDSKMTCDSASGASVVAIDNKIEQAMDLVKSHLMYAVREEVEVLKEQIKELCERNSVLERENAVLKSLANNEQLSQLSVQSSSNPSNTPPKLGPSPAQPPPPQLQPQPQPYLQLDINKTMDSLPRQPQPNVTSA